MLILGIPKKVKKMRGSVKKKFRSSWNLKMTYVMTMEESKNVRSKEQTDTIMVTERKSMT